MYRRNANILKQYMYIFLEECTFWKRVTMQANVVKDDGTLLINFNFILSSLLVIFLVSWGTNILNILISKSH